MEINVKGEINKMKNTIKKINKVEVLSVKNSTN